VIKQESDMAGDGGTPKVGGNGGAGDTISQIEAIMEQAKQDQLRLTKAKVPNQTAIDAAKTGRQ
jgi:hypothetical protein